MILDPFDSQAITPAGKLAIPVRARACREEGRILLGAGEGGDEGWSVVGYADPDDLPRFLKGTPD